MTLLKAFHPALQADETADLIAGFLAVFGRDASPAHLRLWGAALAPHAEHVEAAMVAWLRVSSVPPVPADLIALMPLPAPPSLVRIAAGVAEAHGLTIELLRGDRRDLRIAHPRQEVMALADDAGYSLSEIGRFLGGRDHSTVRHGIDAHRARRAGR